MVYGILCRSAMHRIGRAPDRLRLYPRNPSAGWLEIERRAARTIYLPEIPGTVTRGLYLFNRHSER
jgi:hypothetical protein